MAIASTAPHGRPVVDGSRLVAFVHIAKTAGSTVKFVLRNSLGLRHCNLVPLDLDGACRDEDLRLARRLFPGLRTVSGHSLRAPTRRLEGPLDCFTFLRDPVRRSASHFQQVLRKRRREGRSIGLEEYLSGERHRNVQVTKVAGAPDLALAKRELLERYFLVGLTERFAESAALLDRRLPWRLDLGYPRLHVTRDREERDRLLNDPGTLQLLTEANDLDLELHAWVRDELFPRQLEETPPGDALGRARERGSTSVALRFRMNKAYQLVVYRRLVRLARRRTASA